MLERRASAQRHVHTVDVLSVFFLFVISWCCTKYTQLRITHSLIWSTCPGSERCSHAKLQHDKVGDHCQTPLSFSYVLFLQACVSFVVQVKADDQSELQPGSVEGNSSKWSCHMDDMNVTQMTWYQESRTSVILVTLGPGSSDTSLRAPHLNSVSAETG